MHSISVQVLCRSLLAACLSRSTDARAATLSSALTADAECAVEDDCALSALQARASTAQAASAGNVGTAATAAHDAFPWNYHSFQVGDWPEKYPLCAGQPDADHLNNQWQSPIDIPSRTNHEESSDRFIVNDFVGCPSADFQFQMDYFAINFSAAGCDNITAEWRGKSYKLLQYHFHMMSETMLDGKRYMGEIHLVHKAADGSDLVVGQFLDVPQSGYQGGDHLGNDYIHQLVLFLNKSAQKTLHDSQLVTGDDLETADEVVLNPYRLLRPGSKFYNYLGSLTTPPCTPNIEWISLVEPITVSQNDFSKYHNFLVNSRRGDTQNSYGFDDRPPQPLDSRKITIGAIGADFGLAVASSK